MSLQIAHFNFLPDKQLTLNESGLRSALRSTQPSEGGPSGELAFTDPDLSDLVAAWPTLAEPIRAAIMVLLKAARQNG